MRRFLMTVFWITNVGGLTQLAVVVSAGWIVLNGSHSFSGLSVDVFFVQYTPWLLWVKALILAIYGDLGVWVFSLPVLAVAPLKLMGGTLIGYWAYSVASEWPEDEAVYA